MSQTNTAHIDDPTESNELECVECGDRITHKPRQKQRIRGMIYHDCEDFGPPFAVVGEGGDER